MVPRLIPREESFVPYAELWNLVNPEMPKTPAIIEAEANHDPDGTFEENWLFEIDGNAVGLVLMYDPYNAENPKRLNGDILIRPEFEAELAELAVEIAERSAETGRADRFGIWTTSRLTSVAAALEARGFDRNQVAPVSRVDLNQPIKDKHLEKRRQAESLGLRFVSMKTLDEEGWDWAEPLHISSREMLEDMPHAEEPNWPTLEQYRQNVKNAEIYQRDLMFCALEGDRIVGYTRVQKTGASDETVLTGLTGVVRSHRRRGLATALKAASIELLREQGYRYLVTDNDDRNPMYQINLDFGFKTVFEFWRFNKVVRESE